MADTAPAIVVDDADSDDTSKQVQAALVHRARSLKYRTKVRRKAHKGQAHLRRTKTSFESLDSDFFGKVEPRSIGLQIGSHDLSNLDRKRVARRLGDRIRRRTSRQDEPEEDLADVEDDDQTADEQDSSGKTSAASTRPSSIPEASNERILGSTETQEPEELPPDVQATDFAALNFHIRRPTYTRQLTIDNDSPDKPKNHTGRRKRYTAKLKRSPSYVQESLKGQREEIHKQEDAMIDQALENVGIDEEEKEERIEWDVLYECQRGVNGRWSANALLPFDPAAWVTDRCRPSPYTPALFPIPNPTWRLKSSEFRIDKRGKIDPEGWEYAFSFAHARSPRKKWHTKPLFSRSFVRRRRWVRPRYTIPTIKPSVPNIDPQTDSPQDQTDEAQVMHNSEFANRPTPQTRTSEDPRQVEFQGVLSVYSACALLPLSEERKGELLGWEQELDAHNPFLSWQTIRKEVLAKDDGKGNGDESLHKIWRQAVVEINRHRVDRVMIRCKIDREKLHMWELWFGVKKEKKTRHHDHALPTHDEEVVESMQLEPPDSDDVWDLVERKLDHLLKLFEYQSTTYAFLQLVLRQHGIQHSHHRFSGYDKSIFTAPSSIRPEKPGRRLSGDAEIPAASSAFRPRLQYFHHVESLRSHYMHSNDAKAS